MKIILLSDVKPLGKRGDVATVTDGYANNFLLPRKLATVATPGAIKQLEQQNNAKKRRQAEEVANAQDVATQLEEQTFEILAKAGGNGRLFGTVTNANVADAIATALNVAIDRHKIEMKDGNQSRRHLSDRKCASATTLSRNRTFGSSRPSNPWPTPRSASRPTGFVASTAATTGCAVKWRRSSTCSPVRSVRKRSSCAPGSSAR